MLDKLPAMQYIPLQSKIVFLYQMVRRGTTLDCLWQLISRRALSLLTFAVILGGVLVAPVPLVYSIPPDPIRVAGLYDGGDNDVAWNEATLLSGTRNLVRRCQPVLIVVSLVQPAKLPLCAGSLASERAGLPQRLALPASFARAPPAP